VPRLWDETIEAHRRAVRDATLDTTAALVAEHGLASVTMSQIAEHLQQLAQVRDDARHAGERLKAVLEAYALIVHEHHGGDLAGLLHRGAHVARAHQELRDFVRDLLAEGTASAQVREDVAPEELASYCLHAVAAARGLPSKAAVQRLVTVILAGLQPPH
jgi:hypothetical protein